MRLADQRETLRRAAVVAGLAAVGFVAPVLDIYGRNPEVFVANRTSRAEIVIFALAIGLLIPLVGLVSLQVAGLFGERAQRRVYLVLVVLLAFATGLAVSRQVMPTNTAGAIILAGAVGVGLFWLVRGFDLVLVMTSLSIPIIIGLFLFASSTSSLLAAEPEPEPEIVGIERPNSIVMLQLDEMPLASIMTPEGSVNRDLFPAFSRLAEEGTWYRNALADSIATTQSVPAILSGIHGETGMSPSYNDYPNNLFTLLGESYEMHVIEWVAELCPEETCPEYAGRNRARFANLLQDVGVVYGHLTLPEAARLELPSIENAWKGFLNQEEDSAGDGVEIPGVLTPDEPERADWVNWIQRIQNGIEGDSPPTLSYAHLKAPHVPWETNPSGTHYERPEQYTEVFGVEGDGRWGPSEALPLVGYQRHLYQIGFLDLMLGRLLDHLAATGAWDDTMIIVVADHGASFVPGEHRRWPYEDNRDDLYRIPLLIKYPGQAEGEIVDLPVFGMDILPTVVDVLGVDTNWDFDGESLLTLQTERPHEPMRWCCNGSGASTDISVLFDQVKRNHTWIPKQSSWLDVASAGEHGGVVGRSITDVSLGDGDAFHWSLDLGSELADADLSKGFAQTLLTGRIEAEGELPAELGIVINDRVGGIAHVTRDSATSGTFIGMIIEDSIVDGPNEIELIAPRPDGTWVAGASRDLSLQLLAPGGRELVLVPEGSRRIQVDRIEVGSEKWVVAGWAADVDRKVPPDTFYVYAGDQLLTSGPPNADNGNVVRWFGSEDLLRSGFEFEIPAGSIPAGLEQLLVVAEFGDRAIADSAAVRSSGG